MPGKSTKQVKRKGMIMSEVFKITEEELKTIKKILDMISGNAVEQQPKTWPQDGGGVMIEILYRGIVDGKKLMQEFTDTCIEDDVAKYGFCGYKGGDLVEGSYIYEHRKNKHYICIDGEFSLEVIPETVGQYTGIKDLNGKKIFGGDNISYFIELSISGYIERTGVVKWDEKDAAFYIESGDGIVDYFSSVTNIEIID